MPTGRAWRESGERFGRHICIGNRHHARLGRRRWFEKQPFGSTSSNTGHRTAYTRTPGPRDARGGPPGSDSIFGTGRATRESTAPECGVGVRGPAAACAGLSRAGGLRSRYEWIASTICAVGSPLKTRGRVREAAAARLPRRGRAGRKRRARARVR